jgi:hypothetical protein
MNPRPAKPSAYLRRLGIGASAAAVASGNTAMAWLMSNGCTQASVPQVTQFQTDYNAGGYSGQLTVDGQYGGNTESALQEVLGSGTAVPVNCFGMAVPQVAALDSAPTGALAPLLPNGSPADNSAMWIIGGAAALGVGVVGYAFWRAHKRGRR